MKTKRRRGKTDVLPLDRELQRFQSVAGSYGLYLVSGAARGFNRVCWTVYDRETGAVLGTIFPTTGDFVIKGSDYKHESRVPQEAFRAIRATWPRVAADA